MKKQKTITPDEVFKLNPKLSYICDRNMRIVNARTMKFCIYEGNENDLNLTLEQIKKEFPNVMTMKSERIPRYAPELKTTVLCVRVW